MGKCKHCKTWLAGEIRQLDDGRVFQEYGECVRARMWDGECEDEESTAHAVAEKHALLMTAPDHGCEQFSGNNTVLAWLWYSDRPCVFDVFEPVGGGI